MLQDVWLGHLNIQMMAARDQKGRSEGLFLAAWGGHNAQSHNHNDVGSFVIFEDGKPIVIDIGRPTYRRQTFSNRRYEIWAFQSGFHNLPTINGVDQKAGRQFSAKNVSYHKSDSGAYIEMDITEAYPKAAGTESWNRIVRFNRGKTIVVVDSYTLTEPSKDIIENFVVAGKVTNTRPGKLVLNDREQEVKMLLEYNSAKLSVEIEPIQLKDSKLRQIWGDYLYRIRLKTKNETKKDQLEFRFSKMK
ncbi:MAG: heparinase II/III family protein [Planctomycetes bacterium]|nr:heparinase II/III family protein [Planctomycetota bacterium]